MAGGHEHYEEHKLYPYLEARFSVDFSGLRAGHERLSEHRTLVREALATEDRDTILQALTEFDAVLGAHLDEEEDAVIPLLLELPPDEFEDYVTQPISQLLANTEAFQACAC